MTLNPNDDLIHAFKALSDHTFAKCKQDCTSFSCCSKDQCLDVIAFCQDTFGITLPHTDHPQLPLMGPQGCTALPHQRPLCTVFICDKFFVDEPWSERYHDLRDTAGDHLEDLIEKATLNTQPDSD